MNRTTKNPKNHCRDIQKKIFDYLLEGENERDFDRSIQKHIKHCEDCAHYIKVFSSAAEYLPEEPKTDLRAESNISRHIQNYLDIIKFLRKRDEGTILEKILDFFSYRIPVYQAVSGIMIVFFASMLMFGGVFSTHDSGEFLPSVKLEKEGIPDLYLVDSLGGMDTLTGQNAQEDSVLIQFLVPSL